MIAADDDMLRHRDNQIERAVQEPPIGQRGAEGPGVRKRGGVREIQFDRRIILETAVEAHIKAQSTEPKRFSTAPQFTKMVN